MGERILVGRGKASVHTVLKRDLAEIQCGLVIASIGIGVRVSVLSGIAGRVGFGLGHIDRASGRRVRSHARGELLAVSRHARQIDVGHVLGADHGVSVGNTGKTEGSSQSGSGNNRFETHFS